jgi:hypothetical protein
MSKESTTSGLAGKLLAAVSVLGVAVGMAPAVAADQQGTSLQDKHSTQIKGDSSQIKVQSSNQIKIDSNQYKESHQLKYDSHQLKLDSMQHKSSNQMKYGDVVTEKQNTHELNPQPLPPGAKAPNGSPQ